MIVLQPELLKMMQINSSDNKTIQHLRNVYQKQI